MLLLALGQTLRPTKDLDLLGFGSDDLEELSAMFREIMGIAVEDGITFDPQSLKASPIREELEYGGVRFQFLAYLDTARIPVQVDIGFGDAVTPAPVEQTIPTLLELPAPRVRAYPLETVVAEKLEALVKLGLLNTYGALQDSLGLKPPYCKRRWNRPLSGAAARCPARPRWP